MAAELRVGTSGWHYEHWREVFYPLGLPARRWLQYYAEAFDTVEINNSFYRLPSEKTFASWREKVPEGFLFAVKASRFITHIKRLKGCEEPLALFLRHAACLGDKLGPILFQLPPRFRADKGLLSAFLELLPAQNRYVFEFRDESWFNPAIYRVLEERECALCVASSPNYHEERIVTARFTFLRFHGGKVLYGSNYSHEELEDWADFACGLIFEGIDVYAYFNNDAYGYAVANAAAFKQLAEKTTGFRQ
jgi:uncharacterized protein YecE (DUF72 family)